MFDHIGAELCRTVYLKGQSCPALVYTYLDKLLELAEKMNAHTLMQITYIYKENDSVSILAQPKSRPGTGYSWFSHMV